jgi:hypothetical protein
MTDVSTHTHPITITRYGIAEVLKWCVDRNHKQITGTDTAAFQRMKAELQNRPVSSDYFTLDQYWKQPVTIDFTDDEIRTVDRCLYENPNAENNQNPAIRYRFWVPCDGAKNAVAAAKEHA